jgi:hypothetical protein
MRGRQGCEAGEVYAACALQGAPGCELHFSMEQVAPCWQPMVQLPPGQLRMVQVAPAVHCIRHLPEVQVSITQVAPAEQWSMEHPASQWPTVHLEPGPHSKMLHPPVMHSPMSQTVLAPAQRR